MLVKFNRLMVAVCAAVAVADAGPLGPGDVAIVAVNTDDDTFAWVALRDIPASNTLHFTDSSVSNGLFRWSEHLGDLLTHGPLNWTSPTRLSAGTVVRWDRTDHAWSVGQAEGAALSLSSAGDQVIVYTGSIVSNAALAAPWCGDPTGAVMLTAANIANQGWDNLTGGTTETSFVPPGLSTNDGTAVHLGSLDDACYIGPCRGFASQIRAWLTDPSLWRNSNVAISATNWPTAFDVLPMMQGTVFSMR